MSTHEGLPVAGYKPQSAEALAVVNGNKWLEELLLRRLDVLAADPAIDKRWLQIGRTAIEVDPAAVFTELGKLFGEVA
ncbi:Acb2/Tad1 domain-containing protein [Rhodobacter capsulatus]|uniref:Acb2/Tad1 domain-containing protein n=1 Tax=Rhodobacter capsulatus TaxID=1061 RepID=UPI004025FAD2